MFVVDNLSNISFLDLGNFAKLNKDSFALELVGLVIFPFGDLILLPDKLPEII